MNLEEKINADLKAAMMAKDQSAMRTLRLIKSQILLAKTEKGAAEGISAEKELAMLQKMVKQRKESIAIYDQQQRPDLAQTEREEVEIIERYLPKMMSEEEVREAVKKIITESGATSMKEMGKVMGMASKALAGQADNKLVSEVVKSLLS